MKGNLVNEIISNIDDLSSSSPPNFWKTFDKQTRVARGSVPSMVYDNNNNMFLTSDDVRDKWKNNFSSLYNESLISPHDDQYTQLINIKEEVEYNILQNYSSKNDYLNSNISYDEVEKFIRPAGYDGRPICNEVLCKPQITYALFMLFSRIFQSGKNPSLLKRCKITPVPKSAMKDPHIPINYRGISLLSCVWKMYSSLLSNIILSYSEPCNILDDELDGCNYLFSACLVLYATILIMVNQHLQFFFRHWKSIR